MTYRLASGVEQHRKTPETFWIPSDSDKAAIKPGDYAKLIFSVEGNDGPAERMWVLVTARDGDSITGTLDNQPYRLPLKHGAQIEFGPDHVIQILEEQEVSSKEES